MNPRLLFTSALTVAALAACGSVDAPVIDAAGTIDATDAQTSCVPACGAHAQCNGTTCSCLGGYMGDGLVCTDVDECSAGNGGCDVNATCTNTDGSRTCACDAGFVGDGETCRPVWQRIATVAGPTFNGGFGANVAAVGSRIFFANDGDNTNTVFRSFDVGTMTMSANLALPAGAQDFCACGFTQTFVGDTNFIWMFGNEGQRYDTTANRWTAVTSYSTATIGRGESAGVFEPNSGKVLLVGGRDQNNNDQAGAVTFTPSGQTFAAEPGQASFTISRASAWSPPGSGAIYVAGGQFGDNNRRHLVRHTVGAAQWETLADAPADLGSPRGMGHFSATVLFVATSNELFFYDINAAAWWPQGIPVPPAFQRAVTVAGTVYAISGTAAGVEIYKLVNVQ